MPAKKNAPSDIALSNDLTTTMKNLIPKPAFADETNGVFGLSSATIIYADRNNTELASIGRTLADKLNLPTGFDIPVKQPISHPKPGSISLSLSNYHLDLGEEGYLLTITPEQITIEANHPAGVFWGVQTLRQLLPPAIESTSVQPGPWQIPTGIIRDTPRFVWRGAMLDVARHFFSVQDVKRYIDLMAYYKLNHLHLHLTDDQGWRIMINSWPRLAVYGGSTAVGGDPGGYYTQQDYSDLVAYAQANYITIVPEIDMPGHTNAALAAYPELNCDGVAPALYTGIEVGFSSLCVDREVTYTFIDDVLREIAALTPGPYIHVGGDEAHSTSETNYIRFMQQAKQIVQNHGKEMVGWAETARIDLAPSSIAQYWNTEASATDTILKALATQKERHLIMSPGTKAYLDMQYGPSSPLGLHWAGYVEVRDSYEWDPASLLNGIPESEILGVEAPLWSETLRTIDDIEYMAFPRLIGMAEIGWSPATGRNWDEYRVRLGAQGDRLDVMKVNYYRSSEVLWN